MDQNLRQGPFDGNGANIQNQDCAVIVEAITATSVFPMAVDDNRLKQADVFGASLNDFEIWDKDDDCFNAKGLTKEFQIGESTVETDATDVVPIIEPPFSQGSDSLQRTQRRSFRRPIGTEKPASFRRRPSKSERADNSGDRDGSESIGHSSCDQSQKSKGSSSDKSKMDGSVTPNRNGRKQPSRRGSSKSKSPGRRRLHANRKETSMRELTALLNANGPGGGGEEKDGDGSVSPKNGFRKTIVSKSEYRSPKGRSKSLKQKEGDLQMEIKDKSRNLRDALSKGQATLNRRKEPVRGMLARPTSLRKSGDGQFVPKPLASARSLPRRSASFKVRRAELVLPDAPEEESKVRRVPPRSTSMKIKGERSQKGGDDTAPMRMLSRNHSMNSRHAKPPTRRPSHSENGDQRRGSGRRGENPIQRSESFRLISGVNGV